MKIEKIEIINFKALKGDRTFIPAEGLIGIIGPNGSGKSTIANAIAWCLYGPEVLPTGKQDVITWGEKEAIVTVTFSLGGRTYRTRRWQGKGALGGARIDSEGRVLADGLSGTLRAVEALLGADRTTFLTSVFSRQEELSALASLTPANRMKTVLRLLGVDELTGAIDNTRASAREYGKGLASLKSGLGDIDALESEIKSKKRTSAKLNSEINSMQSLEESLTEQSTKLQERMGKLSDKINEHNQYKINKAQANQNVQDSLKTLRSLLNMAGQVQLLPSRAEIVEPNTEELSVMKEDVSFFNRRISEMRSELESKSTECPVCKRPYDNSDQLEQHRQELEKEIQRLEILVDSYSDSIKILEEELRAHQEWVEYDKARVEQLDEYQKIRDSIHRTYDTYLQAQSDANLIVPPEDVTSEIEQIQVDAQKISSEKNQVAIDLAVRKERLDFTSQDIVRLESELITQKKLLDAISDSEHSLKVYETTSKELIALKEKLIASAIPSIESRASAILSEMTGGAFTELSLSSDYDIRYRNNLGEQKEYANLSGGEQDVFALALRLALSEIRADRIGILFLDEVLESLDEDRQELVWSALEKLTRRYNQVFVVTHVEKFRDRMPYLL